jgi:TonB family protein
MAETVLVIEYEPRYIERLREAFAGTPVKLSFARDGREALESLEQSRPSVVILSWILPKTDVTQLIASIHAAGEPRIPILLTVSGYSGRDSHADARRVGAEDLLAKPFSQADLVARVESLLGHPIERNAPLETGTSPGFHPAPSHAVAAGESDRIGSEEIFGELTDSKPEPSTPAPAPAEARTQPHADDLDALLDQTLISLRRKKAPAAAAKGEPLSELDRLVEDTLSGLRRKSPPPSRPPAAEVPPPEPDPFSEPEVLPEKIAPELVEGDETHSARPGARFGQFVLRERIATGGMAEIWLAQMQGVEGFEKLVAIKRILPHLAADQEFVGMFIDEAKIAARLNHPNIIHIYDLGKAADTYYIAMELVDGHDLKSILRRASERDFSMDPSLAIFVASRVAAALDYAHRKEPGLVHRDVSPQNVLISWDGDIKLCDFGIAKATSKVSHTQSGALKGKIQYMSPEQASGSSLDGRSDVFSLGVVLYEMLTGRKLFRGESEISVIEQVRDAKVEAPSIANDEVTPEIDRIVLKALAREPERRYATAAEMARDLEHVLYGFKPTPSVADLAVWMHRIWADAPPSREEVLGSDVADSEEDPKVITLVVPPPEPEPAAVAPLPAAEVHDLDRATGERHFDAPGAISTPQSEEKRGRTALWVALLALALGAGAFAAWRFIAPSASKGAVQVAAVTGTPARQTAAPPPPVREPDGTTDPALVPGDGFPELEIAPAISPEDVDLEVSRRLEAERERLERLRQQQLAREQQQRAPQPQEPSTTTQPRPATPAPVTETTAPEPAAPPAEPPPAETTATAEQAVATTTRPAAPAYRAGDLVPQGTPGLVEPSLISLRKVSYPPMAKVRKVQGIVVVRALVTETGQVSQVEILRSPTPDFGIAAAARDAVEGARFTPATFEGQTVRAWKTLTVPFTL